MTLQEYINYIIEHPAIWKYYEYDNDLIRTPDLNDPESCRDFINDYTTYAKKTCKFVSDGLDYLINNDPTRLEHIADTYFLGIALFRDNKLYFHKAIRNELRNFGVFANLNGKELDIEFNYVWFMITLFHDLGYMYEKGPKSCEDLLKVGMHDSNPTSIPPEYVPLYLDYEKYRHRKDHGICGGLEFDRSLCNIRRFMAQNESTLSWDEGLEKVYHDVAWIIIAHNIWWNRLDNNQRKQNGSLSGLNISGSKNKDGSYKSYPISRYKYPLFTLFCLVDQIEPLKRHVFLNDISIDIFGGHIYLQVKSHNKNEYVSGIQDANSWLMPIKLLFGEILDIECPKRSNYSIANKQKDH